MVLLYREDAKKYSTEFLAMFVGRSVEAASNCSLIVDQSLFSDGSNKICNGQPVCHYDMNSGGLMMKLTFLLVS